jgi:hypothetical protein
MSSENVDDWRDLAGELTDQQISRLTDIDLDDDDERLSAARYHASDNPDAEHARRSAGAGGCTAGHPLEVDAVGRRPIRTPLHRPAVIPGRRDRDDRGKIHGSQFDDGSTETTVQLKAAGVELSAAQARTIAAALLAAAGRLE